MAPSVSKGVVETHYDNDTSWIKTMGKRCIMHKSAECERLRRMCRRHAGNSYPPVDGSNIFEHLRNSMEVKPSSIPGAEDGLHIKGKLKKDQIIGVYEGSVITETEGDYILEIGKGRKGKLWVDADPGKTARLSVF
jgi:hypothetical protein